MSNKITNSKVDELYEEALKAGALGGKLLGAGGGGYLLMYCPYNVKHKVAERMEKVGGQLTDWTFELRGAQAWTMDSNRWEYDHVSVKLPEGEFDFNYNEKEDCVFRQRRYYKHRKELFIQDRRF